MSRQHGLCVPDGRIGNKVSIASRRPDGVEGAGGVEIDGHAEAGDGGMCFTRPEGACGVLARPTTVSFPDGCTPWMRIARLACPVRDVGLGSPRKIAVRRPPPPIGAKMRSGEPDGTFASSAPRGSIPVIASGAIS